MFILYSSINVESPTRRQCLRFSGLIFVIMGGIFRRRRLLQVEVLLLHGSIDIVQNQRIPGMMAIREIARISFRPSSICRIPARTETSTAPVLCLWICCRRVVCHLNIITQAKCSLFVRVSQRIGRAIELFYSPRSFFGGYSGHQLLFLF